ncbi:fused MFS/spermidine synthase [Aliikangiella sp. IMCC44359]|uniref:fused MFS/spermidine synthase n=1 Tax=Aliikangiella sp. IMCC44359 TaxID=3459125 RepID=UPI00403AC18C
MKNIIVKYNLLLPLSLIFFSGCAALIYQVLWIKQLSLLFGNSSQAISTVISAFFLGTAIGAYYWGKRSFKQNSAWKTFALLEFGIALTSLICYFLNDWYALLLPVLNTIEFTDVGLMTTIKFLMAFVVLFLPSFMMGGTIPMVSQALIKSNEKIGVVASLLISINTLGAAAGAIVAGFILLEVLGLKSVYLIAIGINVVVALVSLKVAPVIELLLLNKFFKSGLSTSNQKKKININVSQLNHLDKNILWLIVFMSGALTMAVEVLWVRSFSFIVQGSVLVQSFIVGTFLLALGVGNLLAYSFYRYKFRFWPTLSSLLLLSACLLTLLPFVFYELTNQLQPLIIGKQWGMFIILLSTIIFIPGTILGCIFPFLLKSLHETNKEKSSGHFIGRCLFVNTFGGLIGPLLAGFFLPGLLGVWDTFKITALIYMLAGVFVFIRLKSVTLLYKVAIPLVAVFMIGYAFSIKLPIFWLNEQSNEKILLSWEGSYGAVAVMEAEQNQLGKKTTDRYIRVNNTYTLGGLGSEIQENRQSHLPLLMHPSPDSVYVLGLGTGITAGTALMHNIKQLTVSELVPEVVEASEQFFENHTYGLFDDPRAKVIVEDGRHVLLNPEKMYDVIISDLFLPTVVSDRLYTQEQFELVKSRLNKNGIFCQWLPLYQLTKPELEVITKTMMSVFPSVTIWRGNYSPNKPVIALIGKEKNEPINPLIMEKNLKNLLSKSENVESLWQTFLNIRGDRSNSQATKRKLSDMESHLIQLMPYMLYVGDLSGKAKKFLNTDINTDDKPIVAYRLAKQFLATPDSYSEWVTGLVLLDYLDEHKAFENEGYLSKLSLLQKKMIKAGSYYHRSFIYKYLAFMNNNETMNIQSKKEFKKFISLITTKKQSTLENNLETQ